MSCTIPTPRKNYLWTVEMRAYAVENYLETKNFNATILDFVTKFNPPKTALQSLIVQWVAKFRTEGTVRNLNSITPGRKTSQIDRGSGMRRLSSTCGIRLRVTSQIDEEEVPKPDTLRSTMLRAIKEDLNLFSYRISIHQKLTEADKKNRLDMAEVLAEKIEVTKNFLQLLWTTDEAHCHQEKQINTKNIIYWGFQRPNEVVIKPLHSKKVTVWCAFSQNGIIVPYFFEENGMTTTINSDRYIVIL